MAEENLEAQNEKLNLLLIEKEQLIQKSLALQEELNRVSEKMELMKLEVKEREEHYQNLKKLFDLETKDSKGNKNQGVDDGEDDMEDEAKKAKQDIQNKVFEKLNFHMDKYFTYIEDHIKLSTKKTDIEDENEVYAPTLVQAVLVKCLKTNFPDYNDKRQQGDDENDEDASLLTLKLSKKTTFLDLKIKAISYWGLLSEKELRQGVDENAQGNKQKSTTTNTIADDKTFTSSHTSTSSKPLKQFELLDESFNPIQFTDNEQIERYISQKQSLNDSQYFTLILRRKRKGKKKQFVQKEKDEPMPGQSVRDQVGQSMAQQGVGSTINQEKSEINKQNMQNMQAIDEAAIEDEEDEDEEQKQKQIELAQKRFKNPLFDTYYKFFNRLPYLRKYFIISEHDILMKNNNEHQEIPLNKRKGFRYDDNNICMVFLLLMLLMIDIIYLNLLDNQAVFISHIKQLSKLLNIVQSQNQKNIAWMDISTISDLGHFMADLDETGLPDHLFNEKSLLRQNYEVIGAVRIRQIRTKPIECPYPRRIDRPSQVKCKYETFNAATQQTARIMGGQQKWQNFKPLEKIGIERKTQGRFNEYDASGYIFDLEKSNQTLKNYQNHVIENMVLSGSYFTIETLAQFLTFNLRSTNDGTFFFIEFLLEYTSTGIFPQQPIIIPFSPNIYGTYTNSPISIVGLTSPSPPTPPTDYNVGLRLYILEIMKILFGIAFIIYTLLAIYNNKSSQGFDFKYFISLTFILNLLVIITTFMSVSVAMEHANQGYDVERLQKREDFVDLGDNAYLYNDILKTTAGNTTVLMIRIVFLLNFFNSFNSLISTIQSSYLQIFASFIMLIFVTIGFAFVGMSIWGYFVESFSTFAEAVLSLLLITIGCYDLNKLLETELQLSLSFLATFYFFIYQFMFGIIAVIYIDSYRQQILQTGVIKEEKWSLSHWLLWCFSWIPAKYKTKCEDRVKNFEQNLNHSEKN